MSAWKAIRLVAARDFWERIASRAFQLSTGLTVLLVVGFILVPTFIDTDSAEEWTIGVVGGTPDGLAETVDRGAGDAATVEAKVFATRADAAAGLESGEVDIVVDAAGRLDAAVGPRLGIPQVAGAVLEERGVTHPQMEIAPLHLVQMVENLDRGLPFFTDELIETGEELGIGEVGK